MPVPSRPLDTHAGRAEVRRRQAAEGRAGPAHAGRGAGGGAGGPAAVGEYIVAADEYIPTPPRTPSPSPARWDAAA
eukprot:gene51379-11256_t